MLRRHDVGHVCEPTATVSTDEHSGYRHLGRTFEHGVVRHSAGEYVKGAHHTNSIECFWALLKRSIKGTYISIEPFHLGRYVDEHTFRFNERKGNDASRFAAALRGITGRRLTYRELTANVAIASAARRPRQGRGQRGRTRLTVSFQGFNQTAACRGRRRG